MPFTLTPTTTLTNGDETVIRGRLQTGAYFGPETVLIRSRDGRECTTHVHSHEMEHPEGWPVLPEHGRTVVILYLPRLPEGFSPALVTGLGPLKTVSERVDVSHYLAIPEFWAMQLALHFVADEVDDPALQFLGVSPDKAEEWYHAHVEALHSSGRWPYVRVPLANAKYVELEMTANVEYQDRIWIGDISGSARVLLGYHSGHFSLPAFHVAEVERLASQSPSSASAALWLFATYLDADAIPLALTRELVSRIPGVSKSQITLMADTLLECLTVSGLRWSRDSALGWINNWQHSQRNPRSQLSILTPSDFAYIGGFFS